ncbi:MAG: NUDIX hydrolase [Lachnospiraceae bacterium]|nr:NUDIX hydrolase [Lachnospiraceae bacterium]
MIFKKIDKITSGHFISRYDITYEEADGTEKVYEMISRDKGLDSFERLRKKTADAVVMVVTDETGERILLNREFRLPVGDWVYNFPAGLIEPGETPGQSAKREIFEETGLDLFRIDDVMNRSFSAVGFSNESNICIVGCARGEIRPSDSPAEEIIAGWYTRDQVAKMLRTENFARGTQSYCYLWAKGY